MQVTVLTDNYAGVHTPSEHGLSYLIEYDGKRLLFDTGQSDMFLRNAESMKISLSDIDAVILSHGHYDHGNGLAYLDGFRLICHPGCFVKRYGKKDQSYIGLKMSREELSEKFNLVTSEVPFKISENIIFLGAIPRISDFESKSTGFVFEDGTPDFVDDDSAVAMVSDSGIFVITGCGHAGVVNTLEHAKRVTGEERITGIMGGFHLKENDRQTMETISYLKANGLKHVFPSHCTGLPALSAFYENFGNAFVRTGDIYKF
jgi:7,8-dihydropterin-6-yl-methyl-4-(beta-D-ribofuranosyl)aminobenzene 5'-phosphate synthase